MPQKIVSEESMPVLKSLQERGGLVIRFNVEYTPYLPKASCNLIFKVFYLAKIGRGKNQQEVIN